MERIHYTINCEERKVEGSVAVREIRDHRVPLQGENGEASVWLWGAFCGTFDHETLSSQHTQKGKVYRFELAKVGENGHIEPFTGRDWHDLSSHLGITMGALMKYRNDGKPTADLQYEQTTLFEELRVPPPAAFKKADRLIELLSTFYDYDDIGSTFPEREYDDQWENGDPDAVLEAFLQTLEASPAKARGLFEYELNQRHMGSLMYFGAARIAGHSPAFHSKEPRCLEHARAAFEGHLGHGGRVAHWAREGLAELERTQGQDTRMPEVPAEDVARRQRALAHAVHGALTGDELAFVGQMADSLLGQDREVRVGRALERLTAERYPSHRVDWDFHDEADPSSPKTQWVKTLEGAHPDPREALEALEGLLMEADEAVLRDECEAQALLGEYLRRRGTPCEQGADAYEELKKEDPQRAESLWQQALHQAEQARQHTLHPVMMGQKETER